MPTLFIFVVISSKLLMVSTSLNRSSSSGIIFLPSARHFDALDRGGARGVGTKLGLTHVKTDGGWTGLFLP